MDAILKQLVETFPASEYPNWSFVFGSVITAQVDAFEKVLDLERAQAEITAAHRQA